MPLDNHLTDSRILKPYDPRVFDMLNDFPEARLQLEESRRAIETLGSIICKYGFEDVVAVNLLHKHFDIAEDEIVLRAFEDEHRALMRPRPRAEVAADAVPYLWAYAEGRDGRGWYPLEFIDWPGAACADIQLLRFSDGLLEELGEEVMATGMADIFGIAGLFSRHRFRLEPGMTLLETTEEATRTLDLRVIPRDRLSATADTTQTLWIFSPEPNREETS